MVESVIEVKLDTSTVFKFVSWSTVVAGEMYVNMQEKCFGNGFSSFTLLVRDNQ